MVQCPECSASIPINRFLASPEAQEIFEKHRRHNEEQVLIPDHWGPETTWLPIYNIRTPYDEDEIVHLISEIIRHYQRLSYAEEGDISWPPEGGHNINAGICDELKVSPAVQSLLRRLPYSVGLTQLLIFVGSEIPDYLSDDTLRDCRSGPWTDDSKMQPEDVVIAWGSRDDSIIVLDTKENTIRIAEIQESPEDLNPPNTPLEYPEKAGHYRNFYPRHAPSWLRVQLNKIKALDIIPPGTSDSMWYLDREHEWMRRKLKHIIIGTYGWPDNFQQQAYDRDREELWEKVRKEYEELCEPQLLRFI